ncbi:MAG: HEAT repeat domain-containing protein [Planctomycetota bacterium]
MVIGIGRSIFAISAVAALGLGGLRAQDVKETFQEAKRLLWANEDEKALEKLREVLAANPGHEEAYQLWKETDARLWRYLLAKGGDYQKIADYLLSLSTVERKQRIHDADAIRGLVAKALGGDTGVRQTAALELAANHGEFAVPYLVDALGNADEDEGQTRAIVALERIGTVGTLALLPLLRSDNKTLRMNAALGLRYLRDNRSLPWLQRVAEQDEDAGVRAIAKKAVAEIGGDTVPNSHDLFVSQSHRFLAGDPLLVRDKDASEVVWDLVDGKLVPREVPHQLFALEQSKNCAYGALAVEPGSQEGLVALTRAYVAEQTVIEGVLATNPEDEAMQKVKPSVDELGITVLAAGPEVVRVAVQRSIDEGMIPSAVSGLHTLARLEDPRGLAGSPLLASLGSNDKRLAYASALSLAGMNAPLEQGTREMIVKVLADAVQEQAIKNISVLSPRAELREAFGSMKGGFWVDASTEALPGMVRLAETPSDVVVIDENIKGKHPLEVIKFARRTCPGAKILLIANSEESAASFGDKVDGVMLEVADATALRGKVDELLADADLGPNRRFATQIAEASARAMASLDASVYDLAPATGPGHDRLARVVGLFSLKALAHGGGAEALDDVAKVLAENKGNEEVAVAACEALGRIMARTATADASVCGALATLAADRGASVAVRSAAVAALGRAPLSVAERAKLLEGLRVDPGKGEAGGSDDM